MSADGATLELRVFASADAARRAAAELLAEQAARGGHLALSGGSTPGPAYELAAELEPDWSKSELWFADERCVPPTDERSNYRLVREHLLDRLARPPSLEHRVLGELAPEQAAARYDEELRGIALDLLLLGVGADGHTASLFPNDPALDEQERQAVAVPRPDVPRVTITLPVIERAAAVAFLATGDDKADAIGRAFGQPGSPATPASLARSTVGPTYAFVDRAAGARVEGGHVLPDAYK